MYESIKPLLLDIVRPQNRQEGNALLSHIQELDTWAKANKKTANKELLHFIQKRSYVKALDWVESHETS